ncbi:CHORD domain [Trinorchestia longiramus]|nr:CHORD domain [Trinorchestia longiramus]
MAAEVQCYNKGCGQKFDPKDKNTETCLHHPGEPIFHDADKVWSCCNKRSKDFTEFLSMPGCTVGSHNSVKPDIPPKYVPPPTFESKVTEPQPRPPLDSEMMVLKPTVSASLKQLLQKNTENGAEQNSAADPGTGIKIGEHCKRNCCKATYEGPSSSLELCTHHPGGPVFHEGMKYWSCCRRMTSDFTEFLAQVGCSTGSHLWTEDKSESCRSDCRYDWHQTGSHVYVTVYAKGAEPAFTEVSVNPVRLTASITYSRSLRFQLDAELVGVIDPMQSSVTLAATKVEIKLKKHEVKTWPHLLVQKRPATPPTAPPAVDSNQGDKSLVEDLDAVDLSDL